MIEMNFIEDAEIDVREMVATGTMDAEAVSAYYMAKFEVAKYGATLRGVKYYPNGHYEGSAGLLTALVCTGNHTAVETAVKASRDACGELGSEGSVAYAKDIAISRSYKNTYKAAEVANEITNKKCEPGFRVALSPAVEDGLFNTLVALVHVK